MATVSTHVGDHTFEDFCWIVRDGQKADLINGAIFMASPDNTDANRLFVWLVGIMFEFARRRRLGEVFGSRVAFRLNAHNGPEPDIAFVEKKRKGQIRRGYVLGPPDLALEIVSPESEERDYGDKRAQYEEAGVKEYWIIDELARKVTVLRLDAHGRFREIRPRKGCFHSQVMDGFWLNPAWLWQQPLPGTFETLQLILENA
jgi:Uma2 family endonuclease